MLLKVKAVFFYVYDSLVASTNPGWLQSVFDTLMVIFDEVVMQTNICKTVGMVCQPCRASRVRSNEAYTRQMKGEGRGYKDRQRRRCSVQGVGRTW